MRFLEKILSSEEMKAWREDLRRAGETLVVTNGCFDILHLGHAGYLEGAKSYGSVLLVGVNGDASVRSLKGEGRPINCETDRAGLIAALDSVDQVHIFAEVAATRFLTAAEPDVYIKGGDYTLDSLNQEERAAVESHGGRIEFIPFLEGRSTTNVIQRMTG
jgi:rfaE bifunctional protein nucleotidyltransferase chain/domain